MASCVTAFTTVPRTTVVSSVGCSCAATCLKESANKAMSAGNLNPERVTRPLLQLQQLNRTSALTNESTKTCSSGASVLNTCNFLRVHTDVKQIVGCAHGTELNEMGMWPRPTPSKW